MAQPDQVCINCSKPTGGHTWIASCGHVYHVDCFTCSYCAKLINPGVQQEYEMRPYHRDCLEKLKLENAQRRCYACGKGMPKKGIVCHDMNYHKECFKCDKCNCVLPIDNWFDKKDKVYCKKCFNDLYPTNCSKCRKQITGNIIVTNEGNLFCSKCLKCCNCRRMITGNSYFDLSSELFCKECEPQYRNRRYMIKNTRTGQHEPMFHGLEQIAEAVASTKSALPQSIAPTQIEETQKPAEVEA